MPYTLTHTETPPRGQSTLLCWPHRSLPKTGFVWFIGGTAAFVALPLLAVLGSVVLWGLLPFLAAALAGMWLALSRSYRSGDLREELTITRDTIHLRRSEPDKHVREWTANPYWVQIHIHTQGGPVEDYLTLKGGDREVELGSYLSPDERIALAQDLRATLARYK